MPEPTSEIIRRLDDLTQAMKSMQATMERVYLPREVHQAQHETLNTQLKNVSDDVAEMKESATANRRLAIGALLYPVIAAIVAALVLAAVHH